MKLRSSVIRGTMYNKFKDQALTSMVQSVFIPAVPLSDEERCQSGVMNALKNYTANAMEAAGGFALLENAINTETNPAKLGLLFDIKDACESIADEASRRVAMEATEDEDDEDTDEDDYDDMTIEDNDDQTGEDDNIDGGEDTGDDTPKKKILAGKTLSQLQIDASLTDKEYKKLATKAENIDVAAIADIVNDKVVTAVNAEKESYQNIDNANQRLKDALIEDEENSVDTDEEAEEAAGLIHKKNFKFNSVTTHQTLFSKIQLDAIETVRCTESVNFDSLDSKLLTRVTCGVAPQIFNSPDSSLREALESAIVMASANECADSDAKDISFGTALAVVIMTFMETLNTLNLKKMTSSDVRDICCSNPLSEVTPDIVANNVTTKVAAAIEDQMKTVRVSDNIGELENVAVKANTLKAKLEQAAEAGVRIDKHQLAALEAVKQRAMDKVSNITAKFDEPATEGISTLKQKDKYIAADIATANRMATRFRGKRFDKIVYVPTSESSINVECYNNNAISYQSSFALESTHDNLSVDKYLKTIIAKSDLNRAIAKQKYILFDGSREML